MQMKINREVLLKPLINVTGIVERRHTLPILSNLLLEAKDNNIKLTATDLEMQISLNVASELKEDFSTTISAKKFLDICRSLPESIDIDMVSKDSRMIVKAGKSRFNLQTLPAADYPIMTKVSGESINIKISQIEFKRLLKQVEFAMAQQDIRYYLNGILLGADGDITGDYFRFLPNILFSGLNGSQDEFGMFVQFDAGCCRFHSPRFS